MGGAVSAVTKPITSIISQPAPRPAPMYSAPTTAEVSQSTAASATEPMTIRKRRRGKSPTILTSSTGVEQPATLGTSTLLGG